MSKERYWNKVNRGICWAFSRPASPGLRVCEYHAELFRQKQKKLLRERYRKKVGLGVCVECSNPAVPGSSVCQYHKDKFRRQREDRRSKYLDEGKCVDCGKKNDSPYPASLCSECRIKRYQSQLKKRQRYIKEGPCISCGARLAPELDAGRVTCKNCRLKGRKSS